jgi:hypothetical protein
VRAYGSRMPSFFSRFLRVGRLPEPLREELAPESIVHVAERVRVAQRFSGSAPGVHSALSVNRQMGLVVFTRERLYALLPTVPRLKGPAIDRRWDDPHDGPARVAISDEGMQFDLDVNHVDPRFRGHLSLKYKMSLPDDVFAALPSRSLAFKVSPDYVFHMLGVRVRQ